MQTGRLKCSIEYKMLFECFLVVVCLINDTSTILTSNPFSLYTEKATEIYTSTSETGFSLAHFADTLLRTVSVGVLICLHKHFYVYIFFRLRPNFTFQNSKPKCSKKNAPLKCISNRKKGEMNERWRKKERKKNWENKMEIQRKGKQKYLKKKQ